MEWWDAAFYKTLVWCGCGGGVGGVVVVEEGL